MKFLVHALIIFSFSGAAAAEDEPIAVADAALSPQTLQHFQAVIRRLESERGAYHPALRKVYVDMGQWYRRQGDYSHAAKAFETALHISKVNTGLHDLGQVAIIDLLIDSYSSLHDWQELDKKLHYLLWIYRRNYQDNDDRLLPVIERVGRRYMQAYLAHNGGEAVSYLVKADDLYTEAADIIVKQYGEHTRQLVNILYTTAMLNYHIASNVNDVFKMSYRDLREAMIPNLRPSPYMNEVAVREYYYDQSFYKGRRSLNRIIEIKRSALPDSIIEYAQALVYQGDYYLALNRKWNAMRNYRQAYAALLEHNAGAEAIAAIFGKPRQVEPFSIPGNEFPATGGKSYADAVFTVPGNGWPSHIRIIATHPAANPKLASRGRHAVAGIRYRPRFEAGKPVTTDGVSLHYVFEK